MDKEVWRNLMKLAAVILFAALAMTTISAQENMGTAGGESGDKPVPLEQRTVVGCLSKTANTYLITGGAPGPKQFRIIGGDTSILKGRIGQTVRVVGMVGESDPSKVSAPPFNEGSTTGVGYNTIVVQKIKVVGGLCSNAGEEYPGDRN